jgi:hypothetical protein
MLPDTETDSRLYLRGVLKTGSDAGSADTCAKRPAVLLLPLLLVPHLLPAVL